MFWTQDTRLQSSLNLSKLHFNLLRLREGLCVESIGNGQELNRPPPNNNSLLTMLLVTLNLR